MVLFLFIAKRVAGSFMALGANVSAKERARFGRSVALGAAGSEIFKLG